MSEILRLERRLAGPRAVVFAALTEAALMRRWLCPEDFEVIEASADPRPGGRFRVAMRGPDGACFRAAGAYLELRPPEGLAMSWTWEPPHTMAGVETQLRIELAERAGGTHLTMVHSGLTDAAERDSHRGGWTGALTHLESLVEKETARWTT